MTSRKTNSFLLLSFRSLAFVVVLNVLPAPAHADWLQVKDVDLKIVEGSALDFSGLFGATDTIAERIGINHSGQLAANEGRGDRRRFLCAPLTFTRPHGLFPDHAEADELARQLRMHGYDLARLHHLDTALMSGRTRDFDYDPEQVDRFHYLLAALKKQGIRWMIDAATSWHGAYGDVGDRVDRTQHNLKLSIHYDAESQMHWQAMVTTMLNQYNPYTGTYIIQDPSLMVVTLFNELGLGYNTMGDGYPVELQNLFKNWAFEAKGINNITVPTRDAQTKEAALMMEFLTHTERNTAKWMSEYLRQVGYQGLISAYNNGKNAQSAAARGDMDVVSVHAYHDHPEDKDTQEAISSIEDGLRYVQYFGTTRYLGRPFIVDEYDHPYWNPWRREAGIAVPAYAALQDWDAICRFANPVALQYNVHGNGPRRSLTLFQFKIGLDPVARAGETLAALLYRRSDVSRSPNRVALTLDNTFLHGRTSGMKPTPEGISRVTLTTGVGAGPADASTSDLAFTLTDKSLVGAQVGNTQDKLWQTTLSRLKSSVLPDDNQTDALTRKFESDTREIMLDTTAKKLSVTTPRTEAAVFLDDNLPLALSNLTIESADGPALVSVSSLDGNTLARSERMLIIVATDAISTGATFNDGRKQILSYGQLPVLLQSINLQLALTHTDNSGYALYALALNGSRRLDTAGLQLDIVADGFRIAIDTAQLLSGPTTYFELVKQ